MSSTSPTPVESTPSVAAPNDESVTQWGNAAPRGGRTVINRILKDGAKVPLFLGQTLINSLRDLGYNSTTSALCEHVDNAIQWGATQVRVYFHQTGKRGSYRIDCLVHDNGQGMAPHVLKAAMSFGGSMVYENRLGIGRYGVGMKTAALNLGKVLEVYSWEEAGAIYNMILDVDDVGGNRSNLVELSDPTLADELPSEVADILTKPMVFPKKPEDTQTLLARKREELREAMGRSGTIVYIPDCDRLSLHTAQSLVEHATKEMGRIYRRFIERGLKLYINNRRIDAFDPTYWMESARHTKVEGLTETRSRLVRSWTLDIPVSEGSENTGKATVRLYRLPYEDWGALSRKVLKNDLHIYDDHTVSFMRNDREVAIGSEAKLKLKRHHTNNWLRLVIDFTGELDEAFGVATNKQGVRLKKYAADAILTQIEEELSAVRTTIREMQAQQATRKSGSRVNEAERRASDADPLQGKPLPGPAPETDEEKAELERNLQSLAVGLKREAETDEEAYERIRGLRYVTVFRHDEYWPFYHCDFKFGKVILTINTAHPFFKSVWEPLSELAKRADLAADAEVEDGDPLEAGVGITCAEVLVAVQLMLHSLARTQSQIGAGADDETRQLLENLRREWSGNLATQLSARRA
jgi:hypothetical protein